MTKDQSTSIDANAGFDISSPEKQKQIELIEGQIEMKEEKPKKDTEIKKLTDEKVKRMESLKLDPNNENDVVKFEKLLQMQKNPQPAKCTSKGVETQLMKCAREGDVWGVMEHIGEAGATDEYGWTALMWAAFNGHPECGKLLLDFPEELKETTKLIIGAQLGLIDVVTANL